MDSQASPDEIVPDSEHRGLVAWLPAAARPYALLARFDRPIGLWLLYWPCLFGLGLSGGVVERWDLALWFLLGSVAMRSAGCVLNDIVDRDLDAQVARTASRPLPAGSVSVRAAWLWLAALSLAGLVVLLQVRWEAQLVALASLAPVAAYPFMKRISWWPQAWLGMVFSWGALVGWIAIRDFDWALAMLYAGSICWVIGYDTIYALQDREDDALIGIKSSALRMGRFVRSGVAGFYALTIALFAAAIWTMRPDPVALVGLLPGSLHLLWQVSTLKTDDGGDALAKFRSNRFAGLLFALAFAVAGSA